MQNTTHGRFLIENWGKQVLQLKLLLLSPKAGKAIHIWKKMLKVYLYMFTTWNKVKKATGREKEGEVNVNQMWRENNKNPNQIKFSGQRGLRVPWKYARQRRMRRGMREGGEWCIKSQSCLLVPLPLPQRMVWWGRDERETLKKEWSFPRTLKGGGEGSEQRPLTQQEMSRYTHTQYFSHYALDFF